ncbi:rRNA maturation RNase YbeY [Candidatus Wolfebacteria bacterium CG03_land_8_20_14_0_80_40_12]|uniref:Endoribonuclease YbeY n=1 Tax=Candidatus Wolfebacteria bacterium CG03_land_8_20_14_0_80_40_12 TaxID=1975069 RepID=A0A2M7B5L8_9BACT|nr:MAG: rRNA maturation RNase YbeY [Candidatus Wolfebacteria bacterium CG03_land_8_20_14_0_80_40_12]
MTNKVAVISLDKRFEKFEEQIKFISLKLLRILNKTNVWVEIYLINNSRMKFLNKKFRSQNKTTTVLSFGEARQFILPPSKFKKIGEIYLNVEVSSFKFQVSSLLIHGLLHLLGYEHQKKNDRIKMERVEQKLFRQTPNPKPQTLNPKF